MTPCAWLMRAWVDTAITPCMQLCRNTVDTAACLRKQHICPCAPTGWSVINFAASATGAPSVAFLDTCIPTAVGGNTGAVVAVAEDVKSATISMIASTACGQLNDKIIDLSTTPAGWTNSSNWQNLTLTYASPNTLIAFGLTNSKTGGAKVTLYVSGGSMSIYGEATTTAAVASISTATRGVSTVANSFGEYKQPTAPTCVAGTTYVEKADASGTTYSRQCRPCPDGYYCPTGRSGFSPVATPCAAGEHLRFGCCWALVAAMMLMFAHSSDMLPTPHTQSLTTGCCSCSRSLLASRAQALAPPCLPRLPPASASRATPASTRTPRAAPPATSAAPRPRAPPPAPPPAPTAPRVTPRPLAAAWTARLAPTAAVTCPPASR